MQSNSNEEDFVYACNDCAFDLFDAGTHEADEEIEECVIDVYSPVSGESYTSCNCEDYPCCGH